MCDLAARTEDMVARWLGARCHCGPWCHTPVRTLRADWTAWCRQVGHQPGDAACFTKALVARGFSQRYTRRGRGFDGLALGCDVMGRWLATRCRIDPQGHATLMELFASWQAWAAGKQVSAGTVVEFSRTIARRGFRRRRQPKTNRVEFAGVVCRLEGE